MSNVRGIPSGQLNQLVWLQKNTGTQDTASGQIVDNWQNVVSVWAEIQTLIGRELMQARQVSPELTHRIRVRYRDDIVADRRFLIPQNNTTLGAAIANAGVTTVTLSDSDLIRSDKATVIRVESELMIVTAGFGTTSLTVTRGAFGSTAAAHSNGTVVIRMGICEIESVIDTGNAHVELVCNCKGRDNL